MKLCRYDGDRLGVVRDGKVHDVTSVLNELPAVRWPLPRGDILIEALPRLRASLEKAAASGAVKDLSAVKLQSPVANPNKIIGAPINYQDHTEESQKDAGIAHGRTLKSPAEYGLFLKANSALVGPDEGVALRFTDKRNDHEGELAVIIGKSGTNISEADARSYIAGYAVGLDMTVRGPEVPSLRKSLDTFAVLGPWLVTADEIADPNLLDLSLTVNGEPRQKSNTRYLIYSVEKLIVWASEYYTLYPGDIIMTGTPAGVGPVKPGDTIVCEIEKVGKITVAVRTA